MATPKVFISYSWDGDEHKAWVKNLADELFKNGCEVVLDQYEVQAGDNVTYFMERSVEDTDKVLLILTENYKLKADGRGGGVGYEYSMINAEWYKNQIGNNKFIPVLRGEDADKCKPVFVNSVVYIDMSNDAQFEEKFNELLYRVYDESLLKKPKVGERPDFDKLRKTLPQVIQNAKSNIMSTDEIRKLIGKSKIDKAIDKLEDLAKSTGDTQLANDATVISQNYQENERKNRVGVLSHDEYSRSRSKVADSLLGLLGQVEKVDSVNNTVMDKDKIFELIENGNLDEAFKLAIKLTRGTNTYSKFLLPLNADYSQFKDDKLTGKDVRGKLADITQRFSQIIEKI